MSADLFDDDAPSERDEAVAADAPLAERMRPRTLAEYVGQQHLVGAGRVLAPERRRRAAAAPITSLISLMPEVTAENGTKRRLLAFASRRASVVFPVPGGPVNTTCLPLSMAAPTAPMRCGG